MNSRLVNRLEQVGAKWAPTEAANRVPLPNLMNYQLKKKCARVSQLGANFPFIKAEESKAGSMHKACLQRPEFDGVSKRSMSIPHGTATQTSH